MHHRREPWHCRVAAVALLLVVGAASSMADQPAADSPAPDLETIVADLDSNVFAVREHAEDLLRTSEEFADDELIALLQREHLSPEQRHRLENALFQRFEVTPRAGMGISFDTSDLNTAIVNVVDPRFPVWQEGVLTSGDLFVRADGVPGVINNRNSVRYAILSHDPGERIDVTVWRMVPPIRTEPNPAMLRLNPQMGNINPQPERDLNLEYVERLSTGTIPPIGPASLPTVLLELEFSIPLGRYDQLTDPPRPLPTSELRRAWRIRLARMGVELGDPLVLNADRPVEPMQDRQAIAVVRERLLSRVNDVDDGREELARFHRQVQRERELRQRAQERLMVNQQIRQVQQAQRDENGAVPVTLTDATRLNIYQTKITQLKVQIQQHRDMLAEQLRLINDHTTDARERRFAEARAKSLRKQLDDLNKELAGLNQEVTEISSVDGQSAQP